MLPRAHSARQHSVLPPLPPPSVPPRSDALLLSLLSASPHQLPSDNPRLDNPPLAHSELPPSPPLQQLPPRSASQQHPPRSAHRPSVLQQLQHQRSAPQHSGLRPQQLQRLEHLRLEAHWQPAGDSEGSQARRQHQRRRLERARSGAEECRAAVLSERAGYRARVRLELVGYRGRVRSAVERCRRHRHSGVEEYKGRARSAQEELWALPPLLPRRRVHSGRQRPTPLEHQHSERRRRRAEDSAPLDLRRQRRLRSAEEGLQHLRLRLRRDSTPLVRQRRRRPRSEEEEGSDDRRLRSGSRRTIRTRRCGRRRSVARAR